MNKENIKLIKELFNFNQEINSLSHLNIIIAIFFIYALNLTVLIFCVNNLIGKIVTITFSLIFWIFGVGLGLIRYCKRSKELKKHQVKIKKFLK